jgi:transglutaminase-like putative cysteine protease
VGEGLESEDRLMARRAVRKLLGNVEVVLIDLLVLAAISPFGRLFADRRYLTLGAGAAFGATALALIISPRLRLPAAIAVSTVGGFGYLAALTFHSSSPAKVWDGVTGSWSALLTATLPAVSSAAFIALPVVLAWVAAYVGTEIVLRTRWIVGPVIAPCGVFVVALLFTGKRPAPTLLLPLVMILLILLVVLIRANKGASKADGSVREAQLTSGGSHAGLTFGLPSLVVICLLAVALGAVSPFASSSRRVDLRERYTPPVQLSDAITPLAQLRGQLNSADTRPLFTVRFSGIPAGMHINRVRVATLDVYDGSAWTTDGSFALAGHELPSGPTPTLPTAVIHQEYQLGAYPSQFLPALDRPVRMNGKNLAFDRVSGMLAAPNGAPQGFRYSVDSEVADESVAAHATVKPGNDPAFSVLALPPAEGWPSEVVNFASTIQASAKGPYATLQAIADELRSRDFGYNPQARPGHSLGVLTDFLTPPTGAANVTSSRVGYAEQFAAAFAVLARVKGFPSRVAVGYRVDPIAASKGVSIPVPQQKVHAWAEVNLNGIGWVSFDPTNPTPRPAVPPHVTTPPPPHNTPVTIQPGTPHKTGTHGLPVGIRHHHRSWLWLLVIPVLLIGGPLLVVGLKALRRRRRSSQGSPATRVVGAWREVREELTSYGAPVSPAMTVDEATRRCRDSIGDDAATRVSVLGPVVNDALYAPFEPTEQAAVAAWEAEASLRALLNERSTPQKRVLAAIDPRPLIHLPRGGSN